MSLQAIRARAILTPTDRIEDGCVLVRDAGIEAVGPRSSLPVPAEARWIDGGELLVPGFIDVHVHGAGGHDVMEGSPEALREIGQVLARHGTTAYVPTTVTASVEETLPALERMSAAIRQARQEPGWPGAAPLGIHLEGPFISRRQRGAHPEKFIQESSVELLQRMLAAARGEARILTLAAEIEGVEALLRLAGEQGVVVALGHSDATYDETMRAIDLGARHAVHLFNAFRAFHHREPGIVGAILTDARVTAELIADGVHVEPAALRLAVAAKGPDGVILVSDATSATGMPEGSYQLGPIRVTVRAGVCRNEEGHLAGSVLTLDRALRTMVKLGFELSQVVRMLTLNPARLLGLDGHKGVIAPGADADVVFLGPDLEVRGTVIGGRLQPAP